MEKMGAVRWVTLLLNFAFVFSEEIQFFGNENNRLSSKDDTAVYFHGKNRNFHYETDVRIFIKVLK